MESAGIGLCRHPRNPGGGGGGRGGATDILGGSWGAQRQNGQRSQACCWKWRHILQPSVLCCRSIRRDPSYERWNLSQGRLWPFGTAQISIRSFISMKCSLQSCVLQINMLGCWAQYSPPPFCPQAIKLCLYEQCSSHWCLIRHKWN